MVIFCFLITDFEYPTNIKQCFSFTLLESFVICIVFTGNDTWIEMQFVAISINRNEYLEPTCFSFFGYSHDYAAYQIGLDRASFGCRQFLCWILMFVLWMQDFNQLGGSCIAYSCTNVKQHQEQYRQLFWCWGTPTNWDKM